MTNQIKAKTNPTSETTGAMTPNTTDLSIVMRSTHVKIELSREQATELRDAAEEIQYISSNVHEVMQLLWSGHASGWLGGSENQEGVIALFDMTSRAMLQICDKEGKVLGDFGGQIRTQLDEVKNASLSKTKNGH